MYLANFVVFAHYFTEMRKETQRYTLQVFTKEPGMSARFYEWARMLHWQMSMAILP